MARGFHPCYTRSRRRMMITRFFPIFLLSLVLWITGCASTPQPTGDRIVSVSWVNRSPTPYRYVQTEVCGNEPSLSLEGLPPYSERALPLGIDLTQSCKVTVVSTVGKQTLPRQSNWIGVPRTLSPDGNYHLRIQVYPSSPPKLTLEPLENARKRLQDAGRSVPAP